MWSFLCSRLHSFSGCIRVAARVSSSFLFHGRVTFRCMGDRFLFSHAAVDGRSGCVRLGCCEHHVRASVQTRFRLSGVLPGSGLAGPRWDCSAVEEPPDVSHTGDTTLRPCRWRARPPTRHIGVFFCYSHASECAVLSSLWV